MERVEGIVSMDWRSVFSSLPHKLCFAEKMSLQTLLITIKSLLQKGLQSTVKLLAVERSSERLKLKTCEF